MPRNNKVPIVLITGANGLVGTALVHHFTQKSWQVRALVRRPGDHQPTTGVTYFEYDLTKPIDSRAFQDASYLIHTSYVKYDRLHPDANTLNVQGAERLLDTARHQGLRKNIFMSSMSAHDEAESQYGQQKLQIEKLFNTGSDVNIRSGLVIGNGGIVKDMSAFMKSKHVVPLIGGGQQPLQIIGIHDLVAAIDRIIKHDISGTLTIATTQVYSYKQFYQALARQLNVKVIFVRLPYSLLLGMLRVGSFLHLPLSVGEDNLLGLKKLRSVDNARDLKRLDLKPDDLQTALQKQLNPERT